MNISIKEIGIEDLTNDFLKDFNRYQKVTKVWRTRNAKQVIEDIAFVEQWDREEKVGLINEEFIPTLKAKGTLYGALDGEKLIGFALIDSKALGPKGEYRQLLVFHVSYDYRGRHIGKALFEACTKRLDELKADKLYISAHSSIETIAFYKKMGCKPAKWLYDKQVDLEPCDCQLEFDRKH